MLRVRIDGGALTTEQLRVIGQISTDFARDTADLTDRQNIQLHWIRVEDVPEIWRRLEGRRPVHHRGLRRRPARHPGLARRRHRQGRDHRPHAADPRARRAVHRRPGAGQPAAQVQDRHHRPPQPGRGPRDQRRRPRGHGPPRARHRLRPVGRRRALHQPRAWPSGSARSSPRSRSPTSGTASPPSSATTATAGMRNKARLKFLLADWGTGEVPPDPRGRIPRLHAGRRPGRAQAHHPRRPRRRPRAEGRQVLHRRHAARRPRLRHPAHGTRRTARAERLRPAAHHPAPEAGCARRPRGQRRTPRRGARRAGPVRAPVPVPPRHHRLHRHRVLQARDRRDQGHRRHRRRSNSRSALADLAAASSRSALHINGCPNSCARIQTADIGLKGMMLPTPDGDPTPGFQVHLGGGLASSSREEAGLGPHRPRPQGHRGGPARLRGARGPEVRSRPRRRPDLRRMGLRRR